MQILIPIAGRGLRFKNSKYTKPKPLIDIFGKPMIIRALENFNIKAKFFFILKNNDFFSDLKKVLIKEIPNCQIIITNEYTEGPACSALLAKKYLDMEDELIITNCDQYMNWNIQNFVKETKKKEIDGLIVTYKTDVIHNSYAKIQNGYVVEIKEKEVISEHSLNGVHYWRKASFFVESSNEMISTNDRAPNGEFYIGPTYNYMINKGYKIGYFNLEKENHYSLGNVTDLDYFFKNEKL